MKNKLTEQEIEKIKVERCVQSFFSRDECRSVVLTAARYLEVNGVNGANGICSESTIDTLNAIALAFAAGELDWVKDLGRDEE